MIDGVSLNRLIGQALDLEKKERKNQRGGIGEEKPVVNLSEAAKEAQRLDSEELTQKLERIKREIANGTYEVNTDKIVEGIKKFI
jgi:anti-sigma28 factor (negative regulator of flagellin synthesis)